MKLSFRVPGSPVPSPRPRFTRTGKSTAYHSREYHDYRSLVRDVAQLTCMKIRQWPKESCEYDVSLHFTHKDRKRRDLDNLAKTILDALNGAVWKDDSQVSRLLLTRDVNRTAVGVSVCVSVMEEKNAS